MRFMIVAGISNWLMKEGIWDGSTIIAITTVTCMIVAMTADLREAFRSKK